MKNKETMHRITCVLAVIWQAFAEFPSQNERYEIIANLTKLREDVQPEASNMNLLSYSEKLGRVAYKWVSRCIPDYPSDFKYQEFDGIGFIFSKYFGQPQFKDAISLANNSKSYDYAKNLCTGACQYYKQAVTATSTEVGCAKKYCSKIGLGLVACAFNNADNRQRGLPYVRGASCSECPENYSCVHKQCSAEPPPTSGSDTTTLVPATLVSTTTSSPSPASTTPALTTPASTTTASASTSTTTTESMLTSSSSSQYHSEISVLTHSVTTTSVSTPMLTVVPLNIAVMICHFCN
uniref:SCP domain-containing protein n=1 Tax=Mesocestoides corti TaxID=53468 RepID=A0A5K3F0Y1_MESCO